ncbi:unnamed protein product [Vitrella brassicaformis CCMP3155]|uniref:Uncharacterized protein n=1 Tax=Vitrella brassicaformis (strain CCMP3155) TaxID=1169540 RepID=A0A0G4EKX7_VITBC|nr:unnamed protein product [Vitrella brassicaformis CCMP3155]|eukprot:CEL97307.1 unnamed protein product [Vitrella brassicaformis CCMP3155]
MTPFHRIAPLSGHSHIESLKLFVLPYNHADRRERLIKEAEIKRDRLRSVLGKSPLVGIYEPHCHTDPSSPATLVIEHQDGHVSEEECLIIALQLLPGEGAMHADQYTIHAHMDLSVSLFSVSCKEWQPVDDFLKEHSFSKLAQLKENEAEKDPEDIRKKLQSLVLGLRLYRRCNRVAVQLGVLTLDNFSKDVFLKKCFLERLEVPGSLQLPSSEPLAPEGAKLIDLTSSAALSHHPTHPLPSAFVPFSTAARRAQNQPITSSICHSSPELYLAFFHSLEEDHTGEKWFDTARCLNDFQYEKKLEEALG